MTNNYNFFQVLTNNITNTLVKNVPVFILFIKKLFQKVSKEEIAEIIQSEYTGQYNRKIWFLYEWLMQELLPIPDLNIKNFVPLIDEELQYASQFSLNSSRHRIQNNLPGTVIFVQW